MRLRTHTVAAAMALIALAASMPLAHALGERGLVGYGLTDDGDGPYVVATRTVGGGAFVYGVVSQCFSCERFTVTQLVAPTETRPHWCITGQLLGLGTLVVYIKNSANVRFGDEFSVRRGATLGVTCVGYPDPSAAYQMVTMGGYFEAGANAG